MLQATAPKKIKLSVLKRVFAFAEPYKGKFYFSIFLSILLALMAPVRPLLIQFSINDGLKNDAVSNFINGPGGFLIEITILQIVLLIIETGGRFLFTFTTASWSVGGERYAGKHLPEDCTIKFISI